MAKEITKNAPPKAFTICRRMLAIASDRERLPQVLGRRLGRDFVHPHRLHDLSGHLLRCRAASFGVKGKRMERVCGWTQFDVFRTQVTDVRKWKRQFLSPSSLRQPPSHGGKITARRKPSNWLIKLQPALDAAFAKPSASGRHQTYVRKQDWFSTLLVWDTR